MSTPFYEVAPEPALRAMQKRVDMAIEAPGHVSVLGLALMLHALLSNLVDNAIGCTPRGGGILLRVNADNDHAVVEVRDSGPASRRPSVTRCSRSSTGLPRSRRVRRALTVSACTRRLKQGAGRPVRSLAPACALPSAVSSAATLRHLDM